MQAKYIAKKTFKYKGELVEQGKEWKPTGSKFDDAIKMHMVTLSEATKRPVRRKKATNGASSG